MSNKKMRFMTVDGGLYLLLDYYFKDGAMHHILWPYDDKARADYEAREKRSRGGRRRKH